MLEMLDHAGSRKPAKCSAPGGRNVLALLGEAFDMRLVNDRILPGDSGLALLSPGERLIDHHAFRHSPRIIEAIEGEVGARTAGAITEMGVAPNQPAADPFGIGIDQKLVGIEAKAAFGLIGSINPVPVKLPWHHIVEIAVPDVFRPL